MPPKSCSICDSNVLEKLQFSGKMAVPINSSNDGKPDPELFLSNQKSIEDETKHEAQEEFSNSQCRGLGAQASPDRQEYSDAQLDIHLDKAAFVVSKDGLIVFQGENAFLITLQAVSHTHLTLQTKKIENS